MICGRQFQCEYPQYKTCSTECSLKLKEERRISVTQPNHKLTRRRKTASKCRICGEPMARTTDITQPAERTTMHDRCVVLDAINEINGTGKLSRTKFQRLNVRGFYVKEIRDMAAELAETGEIKGLDEMFMYEKR